MQFISYLYTIFVILYYHLQILKNCIYIDVIYIYIYRFKLSLTYFLFSLRMVTIILLLFDQFTNISIKMLV